MSGPTSTRWRLLRSAVFAVVATQIAAWGHAVGGGGAPDSAILLIGAGTVGAIVTGLTLRRRAFGGTFGVMLCAQLAFHLLFTLDAHSAMAAGLSAAHSFVPADPGRMLLFHLLAAALSAFVLARGDAALFGLFALLLRAVTQLRPTAPAERPLWTPSFADFHCPRPVGGLLSRSPRRGPPVAL